LVAMFAVTPADASRWGINGWQNISQKIEVTQDCRDVSPTHVCLKKAYKGACDSQPEIMRENCPHTCGFCMYEQHYEKYGFTHCTDTAEKKLCLEKAIEGNCEQHGYLNSCKTTCNSCESRCDDIALQKTCLFAAMKGECDSNRMVRHHLCPRTCNACD